MQAWSRGALILCARRAHPTLHALTQAAPASQQGPYCSLCTIRDDSHYYSTDESACVLCKGDELWPLWVVLGTLVALGLLKVGWCYRKRAPRLLRVLLRWIYSRLLGVSSQLNLRAKFKQLLTFC